MTAHTKISGVWKEVDSIHCKVSGAWKDVAEGYAKVSGVWEQFYSAATSPPVLSYEFINSIAELSDGPTYTFSSINIGQPGLIVLAAHIEGFAISSVTVNGSNATLAVARNDGTGNDEADLWYYEVTSGSSIDVVVTASGSPSNRMLLGVWRINNYQSATPQFTYSDGGTGLSKSITTDSLTSGDVVIGAFTEGSPGTTTWTGLTEDYDTTTAENNSLFSGASVISSGGALTVTATATVGTSDSQSLVVGVWR